MNFLVVKRSFESVTLTFTDPEELTIIHDLLRFFPTHSAKQQALSADFKQILAEAGLGNFTIA